MFVPTTHPPTPAALTVVRLKSELKKRGLKQIGKKADLIHLLANTPGVLVQPLPDDGSDQAPLDEGSASRAAATTQDSTKDKVLSRSVAAQGFPGNMRRGPFSSPIGAAVASELIMDAELAADTGDGETASLDDEEDSEDLDMEEDDYSSSSSFGEEIEDPGRRRHLPDGFHQINQPPQGARPELRQLPGPTDDMERSRVIMDLLERRETRFDLEGDWTSGFFPQGDVYVVYTKKALRPWDGPHAHRAETHVVVLLSDVFGWEDSFTRSAADQVADVCDAVVLVPDIFRTRPWDNEQPEEEYEAWRTSHDPVRLFVDPQLKGNALLIFVVHAAWFCCCRVRLSTVAVEHASACCISTAVTTFSLCQQELQLIRR